MFSSYPLLTDIGSLIAFGGLYYLADVYHHSHRLLDETLHAGALSQTYLLVIIGVSILASAYRNPRVAVLGWLWVAMLVAAIAALRIDRKYFS